MLENMLPNLYLNWFFAALLVFSGIYCMLVSRNLLRLIIGVELLSKAAILALVACGQAMGNLGLAQSIAITMIVLEVVVVAVGLGLVVRAYRQTGSVDMWKFDRLKG
ncbi:MAG: NADH-quinone oxidoreductase subunit K [Elusimicrobiales bacterium]|nr:NADH-quinone oxidoreductase subunit K [Elusimicrobiales bacterium]